MAESLVNSSASMFSVNDLAIPSFPKMSDCNAVHELAQLFVRWNGAMTIARRGVPSSLPAWREVPSSLPARREVPSSLPARREVLPQSSHLVARCSLPVAARSKPSPVAHSTQQTPTTDRYRYETTSRRPTSSTLSVQERLPADLPSSNCAAIIGQQRTRQSDMPAENSADQTACGHALNERGSVLNAPISCRNCILAAAVAPRSLFSLSGDTSPGIEPARRQGAIRARVARANLAEDAARQVTAETSLIGHKPAWLQLPPTALT